MYSQRQPRFKLQAFASTDSPVCSLYVPATGDTAFLAQYQSPSALRVLVNPYGYSSTGLALTVVLVCR